MYLVIRKRINYLDQKLDLRTFSIYTFFRLMPLNQGNMQKTKHEDVPRRKSAKPPYTLNSVEITRRKQFLHIFCILIIHCLCCVDRKKHCCVSSNNPTQQSKSSFSVETNVIYIMTYQVTEEIRASC